MGRWTALERSRVAGHLVGSLHFSHWDWRALKLSLPACRLDKPRKPCAILHPRSIFMVGDGQCAMSSRDALRIYILRSAGAQHRNTSSMSSGSTLRVYFIEIWGLGAAVASRRQPVPRWSSNDKSERRCFSACRARPLSGLEGGGNGVVSSSRCEIWARQGDSRHCFSVGRCGASKTFRTVRSNDHNVQRRREDLSESPSPKKEGESERGRQPRTIQVVRRLEGGGGWECST